MIITRHKPVLEILECMRSAKKAFLVGCSLCATTCKTGGADQLKEMAEVFAVAGRSVTGSVVLEPACNMLEVKRMRRKFAKEIENSDIIMCFACGGGAQAVSELFPDKRICTGNDTLFQGEITEITLKSATFEQKCSLCGECTLLLTGAICPKTLCPKGLMNGPCGGIKKGKCEVDSELDCAWLLIYERLKKQGRLDDMKKTHPPMDNSKSRKPQKLIVEFRGTKS